VHRTVLVAVVTREPGPVRYTGPAATAKRTDRGAAAVEMAIVLPMLLLIMFAILDYGRLFHTQMTLTAAAREGARVAAFGGDPTAHIAEIAGDDVEVTVQPCPASGGVGADTRVTVQFTFQFVTPIGLLGGGFDGETTLVGQGVMPCQ
jgi:Flp pilus assembly protein TadG